MTKNGCFCVRLGEDILVEFDELILQSTSKVAGE